jgi:hypothetical protein
MGSGGSAGVPDGGGPSDRIAAGDGGRDAEEGGVCGLPGSGLYATFRVVDDVFYVWITNPTGINEAIALWRGQSMAAIPVGAVDCANGMFNCGWTWRIKPDVVRFAEVTIELCDGTPSYVQGHCASFANSYCPWSAQLIALRDCRTDSSCPMVTR